MVERTIVLWQTAAHEWAYVVIPTDDSKSYRGFRLKYTHDSLISNSVVSGVMNYVSPSADEKLLTSLRLIDTENNGYVDLKVNGMYTVKLDINKVKEQNLLIWKSNMFEWSFIVVGELSLGRYMGYNVNEATMVNDDVVNFIFDNLPPNSRISYTNIGFIENPYGGYVDIIPSGMRSIKLVVA